MGSGATFLHDRTDDISCSSLGEDDGLGEDPRVLPPSDPSTSSDSLLTVASF